MKKIDDIKLKYLADQCREKGITSPTRKQIERILKVSYPHAYNYLKAYHKVYGGNDGQKEAPEGKTRKKEA